MRFGRNAVVLAALAAGVAVPAAVAAGSSAPTKKVTVADDYYTPLKVSVKRGTKVEWVWPEDNVDSHDVKLTSAPHGVTKFHSASAASDYTYAKTLKVPGTYKIVCTLHQDMKMTITVKK